LPALGKIVWWRYGMAQAAVDLKREQEATLARPRFKYGLAPRLFYAGMDLVTGKKVTLAKAALIEILASVPYRAWEVRQYARLTRLYRKPNVVRWAEKVVAWGREAQDNEYGHLLAIHAKRLEDNDKDPWYLFPVVPWLMVWGYSIMTWFTALFHIRGAFSFNGEFEDHAEHEYARFVSEHPEFEQQPVKSLLAPEFDGLATWADVFRRIGLDERDHMNASFAFAGHPEYVVKYEGTPDIKAP
jgi:hypothetical protein